MDDGRVREFERSLWFGGEGIYRRCVARDCMMVVPEQPFLLSGEEAVQAVEQTPRWDEVDLQDLRINRPQEGVIVIGYRAEARRGEERYVAYCTSTYQRVGDHDWRVIQHQQTVPATA